MGFLSIVKRRLQQSRLKSLHRNLASNSGAMQETVAFLASGALVLVNQNLDPQETQILLKTLQRQIDLLGRDIGFEDNRIRLLTEIHRIASEIIADKGAHFVFQERELRLASKGDVMPLVRSATHFTSPLYHRDILALRSTRAVAALLEVLREGTYRIPVVTILGTMREVSVIPCLLKGARDHDKYFSDLCQDLLKGFTETDIATARTAMSSEPT